MLWKLKKEENFLPIARWDSVGCFIKQVTFLLSLWDKVHMGAECIHKWNWVEINVKGLRWGEGRSPLKATYTLKGNSKNWGTPPLWPLWHPKAFPVSETWIYGLQHQLAQSPVSPSTLCSDILSGSWANWQGQDQVKTVKASRANLVGCRIMQRLSHTCRTRVSQPCFLAIWEQEP